MICLDDFIEVNEDFFTSWYERTYNRKYNGMTGSFGNSDEPYFYVDKDKGYLRFYLCNSFAPRQTSKTDFNLYLGLFVIYLGSDKFDISVMQSSKATVQFYMHDGILCGSVHHGKRYEYYINFAYLGKLMERRSKEIQLSEVSHD